MTKISDVTEKSTLMPDYMSLRLAVDELTKPVTEWVKDSDGNKTLRTGEPLLEQLRAAISTGMEHGSGGGLQSTRTPIDVGAFTLFEEIDGQVRAWMLDLGGRPGSRIEAGDVLRSWFTMFMVHPTREQGLVDRHEDKVRGWAARIRDLLNPPTQLEITSKCPACQAEWVVVGHGEDAQKQRVLVAVVRDPSDTGGWVTSCKACGHEWRGVMRFRELRSLIDEMEIAS